MSEATGGKKVWVLWERDGFPEAVYDDEALVDDALRRAGSGYNAVALELNAAPSFLSSNLPMLARPRVMRNDQRDADGKLPNPPGMTLGSFLRDSGCLDPPAATESA